MLALAEKVDPHQAHEIDQRVSELIRELVYSTVKDCYTIGQQKRLLIKFNGKKPPRHHTTKRIKLLRWIKSKRFEIWLQFMNFEPEQAQKLLAELCQGQGLERVQELIERYEKSKQGRRTNKGKTRDDQEQKQQERAQGRRGFNGTVISGGASGARSGSEERRGSNNKAEGSQERASQQSERTVRRRKNRRRGDQGS